MLIDAGPAPVLDDRCMKAQSSLVLALVLILFAVSQARAQGRIPRGIPLPVTIVLLKPAPDQTTKDDDQQIEIGVKDKIYKYVVVDGYVDDPRGLIMWGDIWRQIELSRPNFQVQGPQSELITSIEPGQKITIRGMYAPITRTFEVISAEAGSGLSEPPKHY